MNIKNASWRNSLLITAAVAFTAVPAFDTQNIAKGNNVAVVAQLGTGAIADVSTVATFTAAKSASFQIVSIAQTTQKAIGNVETLEAGYPAVGMAESGIAITSAAKTFAGSNSSGGLSGMVSANHAATTRFSEIAGTTRNPGGPTARSGPLTNLS